MTKLEAFPMDPALPQLRIACDPALMREIFREHLRPLKQAYGIEGCQVSWIRYLRSTRCTLQYSLRLVESGTTREQSQWVTGVIYKDHRARELCNHLRNSNPKPEISPAFKTFEPISFIPDLEMFVQVFPYDRRLPALPTLMLAPLAALETESERGDGHSEQWKVEPIRYRTGARAVLRYQKKTCDSATGQTKNRRVYVKVYRDREGARTCSLQQALWKEPDTIVEGFTVGRPIGYLNELHALFQAEAPGTSLEEMLIQDGEAVSAVRRVARALAILNQSEVAMLRRHSREDEIAELKWVSDTLLWARPDLHEQVEAIVAAIAAGLEEVSLSPTHRDFMPDHVLLDGDHLSLLDLDFLADADPVLDPASFLAHLFGMALRFPDNQDRIRAAGRVFTEEYFAYVPAAWRDRLPIHYAGAALKVAVGFFRRQERHWPEKIGALVAEARDSLGGTVWC